MFNKSLVLGIEMNSGSVAVVAFKRSVIEWKTVSQDDAERIVQIINNLVMENRAHPVAARVARLSA